MKGGGPCTRAQLASLFRSKSSLIKASPVISKPNTIESTPDRGHRGAPAPLFDWSVSCILCVRTSQRLNFLRGQRLASDRIQIGVSDLESAHGNRKINAPSIEAETNQALTPMIRSQWALSIPELGPRH